jgi:hypothetical protein
VAAKVKWYPAAIAWRSPDAWPRAELLQLLDCLPKHLSDKELKERASRVLSKLSLRCNAHGFQRIRTALEQLQQGHSAPAELTGAATAVDIDLDTGCFAF